MVLYRCYTVSSMQASLRWPCIKNALSLPSAVTLDQLHSPISVVIKEDVCQASEMESEGMFHLSIQRIPSKGGGSSKDFRVIINPILRPIKLYTLVKNNTSQNIKHKTLSFRELSHDPLRHVTSATRSMGTHLLWPCGNTLLISWCNNISVI